MAWIADPKALRTYDPERGLELHKVGGGSDGSCDFVIHRIGRPNESSTWFIKAGSRIFELSDPDDVLAGFSAYMRARKATEDERSINPDIREFITWKVASGFGPTGWIIKGYSLEESKEIIREAMLAYRYVHGEPAGPAWVIYVEKF